MTYLTLAGRPSPIKVQQPKRRGSDPRCRKASSLLFISLYLPSWRFFRLFCFLVRPQDVDDPLTLRTLEIRYGLRVVPVLRSRF